MGYYKMHAHITTLRNRSSLRFMPRSHRLKCMIEESHTRAIAQENRNISKIEQNDARFPRTQDALALDTHGHKKTNVYIRIPAQSE